MRLAEKIKQFILFIFLLHNAFPACLQAQKLSCFVKNKDAILYYEVSGHGEPVIILHGGLGNINGYSALVDSLKTKYKVIAISTRGHGKSTLGTRKYSFDLFAKDIIAVLDHQKISKASVIGFSDGAVTAYCLAAYYPKRISRITTLAGAFGLSDYKPEGLIWIKTVTGKKMLNDTASEASIQQMDLLIERMRPLWLKNIYITKEKAASIKAPTLIIGGEKDFFFRKEHFEYAHQIIPQSKLVILPDAGHNLKTPTIIHNFILPFLRTETN